MADNKALTAANKAKKDEFYTQLGDIANELNHYRDHFKGKTVLCNCDDPYESNFFKFFALKFNAWGLKKLIFPVYRKEMKGLAWGALYNRFRNRDLNASELETRIQELMADDEIEHPRGVYEYLLTGDERKLSLRAFSEKVKRRVYEQQKGICAKCLGVFDYGQMEADHVTPWSRGGTTTIENCQLLCRDCNRRKSDH